MIKPILRALAGEAVWPPPMWLMRQAGRHLPEYRALRARASGFIDMCTTPELAAEATLQPVRRYGMDAAILFSDILILPWALGHDVQFKEGEGPVLHRLTDMAGVDALDPARVADAVAPILETVRRVRPALGNAAALIGFAGGPFTVACYMVEGGGSKQFHATRLMAQANPALFSRLIDVLTTATIEYLSAQIDAGAEAVMLFDSWAGVLTPRLFKLYVTQPAQRIVAALRARHPDLPIIGFPRLAGALVAPYAEASGVNAVALDTGADLALAAASLPPHVATQGNLDPMALMAGGNALSAETARILAAAHGRPHVFNLGHGVEPPTPIPHVEALVAQVRRA